MEKIIKRGKELLTGYTTGTCAQAAVKAGLYYFFTGEKVDCINVTLPKGNTLTIKVHNLFKRDDYIECSIIKYSGDDPDVTDGMEIKASLYGGYDELIIDGGEGVGRVTKPGLRIPVGEAAINPVPRKMIKQEVENLCNKYNYNKSFKVVISAINGEETAKKTFNSKFGIIGGISILGTSGIVEPMSEKALLDSIFLEIDSKMSNGERNILISPGNYGRDAAYEMFGINIDKAVKISNYMGDVLDYLYYKKPDRVLIIGHAGKLSKLSAGIMNTHSRYGDCRHEIFGSYAGLCGADRHVIQEIFNAVSTDEMDSILIKNGIHSQVWDLIITRIMANINHRLNNEVKCEVIVFTNKENTWKFSSGADEFIKYFKETGNGER